VALSFLMLAVVPAMSQEINIIKPEDNKTIKETTIRIDVPDDSEQLLNFKGQIEDFKTWLVENKPFRDFKLTPEEKAAMKTKVETILGSLNAFLVANGQDPVTTDWLWNEMFETELGRSCIASVGWGMSFIPFYEYETFLGIMLRPMWFFYTVGYTGNPNVNFIPPRIEYGDAFGAHLVRTTVFSGLYINIGKLGINTPGPQGLVLVLGRARVVMTDFGPF